MKRTLENRFLERLRNSKYMVIYLITRYKLGYRDAQF